MQGCHLYNIPKGELGQYSKVVEEFLEFRDAIEQDCKIMALTELADVVGSLKHYFYHHDQKNYWGWVIAHILQDKQSYLPIDYFDLEENFKLTLDTNNEFHWDRISFFLKEINYYLKTYNLSMRDLIRMSHICQKTFDIIS